jgi:hypothetical protein
METWYRVHHYNQTVKKLEVVRTTEKSIFIKYSSKDEVCRANKKSSDITHVRAFDEAKSIAIEIAKKEVQMAELKLQKAKANLYMAHAIREDDLK